MLITILMFIFAKFLSFIFFWRNLVPKSEVLQINWNSGQAYIPICLLQCCLFSQNFCHSYFFGQIWSHNLNFYKMTEILYRGKLLYAYYYDFNLYIFKNFVSHIFWTNLVPKSNVLQIDWNIVVCWCNIDWAYCYMLILVLMCNFSKYWPFANFGGKFHPKICFSPYLLKFSIEIQWTYINQNKIVEASQECENVLVNEGVFYRFYHFSFAHQ